MALSVAYPGYDAPVPTGFPIRTGFTPIPKAWIQTH